MLTDNVVPVRLQSRPTLSNSTLTRELRLKTKPASFSKPNRLNILWLSNYAEFPVQHWSKLCKHMHKDMLMAVKQIFSHLSPTPEGLCCIKLVLQDLHSTYACKLWPSAHRHLQCHRPDWAAS